MSETIPSVLAVRNNQGTSVLSADIPMVTTLTWTLPKPGTGTPGGNG